MNSFYSPAEFATMRNFIPEPSIEPDMDWDSYFAVEAVVTTSDETVSQAVVDALYDALHDSLNGLSK